MVTVRLNDKSGMWTFHDGAFTAEITMVGRTVIHLPSSCRMQEGQMLACSEFNETTDDGLRLTCTTTANGDCDCSLPESVNSEGEGMFSTNGNSLDLGGEPTMYCVKGNRLYIGGTMDVGMSMGGMGARGSLQLALKKK